METTNILSGKRPTAGNAYGHAWDQTFKYFLHMFIIIIFLGILTAPMGWYYDIDVINYPIISLFHLFSIAYTFFFLTIIQYGASLVFLRIVRNEKVDLNELFAGFRKYINIVLANLLTTAIIGFGMVFLLVPGIIFACRLVFVPFLVMEKDLDAVQAVEESWNMTKGHGWTIFGMALLAILIAIAGFLCLGVGILISIMWISLAFAAIYVIIDNKNKAQEIPA